MFSNDNRIDKVIKSLIQVYQPESIIIFGSYAWSEPTQSSDLDIAVIVKDSKLNMAQRIRLASEVSWEFEIPTDILIYTKQEMQEKAKYQTTLQYKILHDGHKVYGAA